MSPFQRVYFSLTSDPNSFSWWTAPPFFLYLITERDPSASNPCWGGVSSISAPMALVFTRKRVSESVFLAGSSPLGPKNRKIWREVVSLTLPLIFQPVSASEKGCRQEVSKGKRCPAYCGSCLSLICPPASDHCFSSLSWVWQACTLAHFKSSVHFGNGAGAQEQSLPLTNASADSWTVFYIPWTPAATRVVLGRTGRSSEASHSPRAVTLERTSTWWKYVHTEEGQLAPMPDSPQAASFLDVSLGQISSRLWTLLSSPVRQRQSSCCVVIYCCLPDYIKPSLK